MQGKSKSEKRQGCTEKEDGEMEARERFNDVESYIVPAVNFILILNSSPVGTSHPLEKARTHHHCCYCVSEQKTCQKCAVVYGLAALWLLLKGAS